MNCVCLDSTVTKARVYTSGLNWYVNEKADITDGPYAVCPYSNFIFYSPYSGTVTGSSSGDYVFYDNDGKKIARFVFRDSRSFNNLDENHAPITKGAPVLYCSIIGNTMRQDISTGLYETKNGAGFMVAFFNGHDFSDIFPDGIVGGLVDITGSALNGATPPVLVYDLRGTSYEKIHPHCEFIESGSYPLTPAVEDNLKLDSWKEESWGPYRVFIPSYSSTDENNPLYAFDIPILWSKIGNPIIPKDAPASLQVFFRRNYVGYYKQAISIPPFFPGSLNWWTGADLYLSGWYLARLIKRGSNFDFETYSADENPFEFTLEAKSFDGIVTSLNPPDNFSIMATPNVAFLQQATISGVNVLLLDKTHGIDRVENYERIGDGVYITYNGAPFIKVWTNLLSTISNDTQLVNNSTENHPPAVFYNEDKYHGTSQGDFAILAWAPSELNTGPSISGDGSIIPSIFLLTRFGKFGKFWN